MQEWKQKRRTMRHYDLQAEIYNVQYLGEQNAKIENILKRMKLEQKDFVLDLGCGTGFLFQQVSKNVTAIVGVDLSQRALREAKKRAKSLPNVFLVCADADYIPFPDDVFDKVFAVTILQNMPNPKKTITEMKRTGKPQSKFALTGLKKKFTEDSFVGLLESMQLEIVELNKTQQLKGYVAVCKSK